MKYKAFSLLKDARMAHNYLTAMVDENKDFLPYWLIGINENPSWAQHCRVDDAELVASWYEALWCVMEMLGTAEGAEVLEGFKRHLLNSWGRDGLRYHEPYSWTHTQHCSIHEMGWVLSALVRWVRAEPESQVVRQRLAGLIRGLKKIAVRLEMRTFWAGDFPFEEVVYRFPNDVYLREGGWDLTRATGRGEESIRNGVILYPLVQAYELTGDKEALDLAKGTANYLLGVSRYFNYRREFFGHVHSSSWVACGLIRLGHVLGDERYLACGKEIVDYVLSLSSSFGWVPEYAQWNPAKNEACETCCIKDMIDASFELVAAGYDEYWDVINRFSRNMLSENQVKTGCFVGVDNTLEETESMTFRNMDRRVVGGYSGGTLPNSMSLGQFRQIAGCCVGTAPQALYRVWSNVVRQTPDGLVIELPMDYVDERVEVIDRQPEQGRLDVILKQPAAVRLRILPFMQQGLKVTVSGQEYAPNREKGLVSFGVLEAGSRVIVQYDLNTAVVSECVAGTTYQVHWRGSEVVRVEPFGDHVRLFQRECDHPLVLPAPPPRREGCPTGFDARPTEQNKQKKK